MNFVYSISIALLSFVYQTASLFNPKARQFIRGRKNIFDRLRKSLGANGHPLVWVHCASLGEFEQGRPVMEALKAEFSGIRILLTFFSPSGYEVRKNYSGADFIFYLPFDSASNARRFVEIAQPALVIFVKYEFWHNYTHELEKRKIPLISVSSIFRPDQAFFAWYGSFFRNILRRFSHFFVQNQESVKLLASVGITNCTLSGDTRFDRVQEITERREEIKEAEAFKAGQKVFVVGSSWPEDMEVITPFINENRSRLKFIVAPHEIDEDALLAIEKSIDAKTVRFSRVADSSADADVLLVDNIGLLSRLYRYGEFAYVGGAFGKGLHNILEAACCGVPLFFGNRNYEKFREARDLILRGGAFEIGSFPELKSAYEMLLSQPERFLLACDVNLQYVKENLGATKKIIAYCRQFLHR